MGFLGVSWVQIDYEVQFEVTKICSFYGYPQLQGKVKVGVGYGWVGVGFRLVWGSAIVKFIMNVLIHILWG